MIIPNLTFVFDRKGLTKDKKDKNALGVVELRIGSGKERKYISTGVWLRPNEWKNGSVIGRKDWHELNNQLDTLKKKTSEIIVKMMEEENLELGAIPLLVKDKLLQKQTFLEYAKELYEQRKEKMSVGTCKHYVVLLNFLEEWRGIVYFSDFTERNVQKMDDELRDRGLKEVTRWNYHKMLKTFMFQAIEDGLIKKNPYARLGIKKGDGGGIRRCLTPVEFHRFEKCLIPMDSLRRVRDLFVFQTYTMMSYSDLADFSIENCVRVGSNLVYKSKRRKTGQEFTTVLLSPAIHILKRYGNKLPMISNVKYNLYLKNAVMYAKIDKPVSTHWARHTGATMLLNEGKVPMHIIQHILGHSSIRETERTYAKLMDETIVETMAKYKVAR